MSPETRKSASMLACRHFRFPRLHGNRFSEWVFGEMSEIRSVVLHVLFYDIRYVGKYPLGNFEAFLRVLKNFWRSHLRFKSHKSVLW